jgi:hypothetical protein
MESATPPPPPPPPPAAQPPPPPPPPPPPAPAHTDEYPVKFFVEYPDRKLDRLSTAFRFIWVIPIFAILTLVSGSSGSSDFAGDSANFAIGAGGFIVTATALMILFRQKYPRWWFDWNLELTRFSNRVGTYWLLMNDSYPSTDEHQWLRLDIPYPDVERDLSRGLPLVKWFLAIPHYFVLFFLIIGAGFAALFAWFAILFTGRYPRGLFDFVEGVLRWGTRVEAYAFILATDKYPPFRLRD